MTARRLFSVLSVALVASATIVAAQPKPAAKTKKPAGKTAPKPPPKPATPDPATGSAAGSAVQMTEDPPPTDPSGTAENPDAPHAAADPDAPVVVAPVVVVRSPGYPIEEAVRPITLPQNLSEISLVPHAVVSPFASSVALRARYGITSKIQIGLTYLLGGVFRDPNAADADQALHTGKAVGLDATVMLQDWIGVSVGVPIYISPLAVSLALGAPLKFKFGDQFALGGLDDLLNIRLDRFAPTFYQEAQNAANAATNLNNTIHSSGELRISAFAIFQYQPDVAVIARYGIQMEDFATGKTDGCNGECLTNFISVGVHFTPRRFVDLGLQLGFDDLAHGGSFAPTGFLAFRI